MDNNNAITHRIATYRPRLLSADAWTHAAAPVRAALTAASPKNPEDAKVLGSSLCAFLASPCGWHPGEVPDLRALLSDAAIERFAAGFTGPQGTRQNHVRRLLALQRALAEVPRDAAVHRVPRRRAAPAPAALRAVCSRSSLPTVAALAERLSGHPLSYFRLEGLIATARPSNVTGIPAGTVPVDRDVLGAYLDADAVQLMTEVVRATTPANTRKTSQRQQLAQARADRAAYRRATQGPRAAAHPDMATLEPAVRSAIETYRPQTLDDRAWAALRPLTVQMVAGFEPPSVVSARNAATIVVAFLQWVWSLPNRPEPAAAPTALELLSGPFVEMYASRVRTGEARRGSAASTSTARTVLRRCVRSLDADQVTVALAHASIDAPYSPEECLEFASLAMTQPTPAKERNACYLIGLGLGAGLSSRDLRHVRRDHIAEVIDPVLGRYLTVTVVSETAARTVPIRRVYEPLVRRALELSSTESPDALVLGRKESRRDVTVPARRGIVTARHDHTVSVEPHRLRTTWLFAAMNVSVPLGDLLAMAGLRSARSLTDLLPLCPPPDPAEVARTLAGLTDAPLHTHESRTDAR